MTVIVVPFHLDEHLPGFRSPAEPDLVVSPSLPAGTTWSRLAALYAEVADVVVEDVEDGHVPVVVSGDCATALGTVAGLQRAGLEPAVVWIDAHGDLQTPETSASGYLGGMPLRQLVGGADRTAPELLGLRTVPEHDVLLVDARDLDPPEQEFLAGSAVRRVPLDELLLALPQGPVYLHLDLDVVDPGELPGLLFPAPHGPTLATVTAAVRGVFATCPVVGVGLACTWRPDTGTERAVAGLGRELAETADWMRG